jgi:hypothetical protein
MRSAHYRPTFADARAPNHNPEEKERPKRGNKLLAFIVGFPLAIIGLPFLLVAAILYPVALLVVGISAQVFGRFNVYLGAAALRVLPSDIALRVLPMVLLNAHSGSWYKLTVRVKTILMCAEEWGVIENMMTPTRPGPRIPKTLFGLPILALWYVFNFVDTVVTHVVEFVVELTRQFIGQQGLRLVPAGFASKIEALGRPVTFGEDWYTMLFANEDGMQDMDHLFGLMSTNVQLATTATMMELVSLRSSEDDEVPADVELINFFNNSSFEHLGSVAAMIREAQFDRFEYFD